MGLEDIVAPSGGSWKIGSNKWSGEVGTSKSDTVSKYLLPREKEIRESVQSYQSNIDTTGLQDAAIGQQQQLRNRANKDIREYGLAKAGMMDRDYQHAGDRGSDMLADRGISQADIDAVSDPAVAHEQRLSRGKLNDQLLGKMMQNETDTTDTISQLLFGASEQSTDLYRHILGSGGIGSASRNASRATNPGISVSVGGDDSEDDEQQQQDSQEPQDTSNYNPDNDPNNNNGDGSQTYDNPYTQPDGGSVDGRDGGENRDGSGRNRYPADNGLRQGDGSDPGDNPDPSRDDFGLNPNDDSYRGRQWDSAFPEGTDPLNPDDDGEGPIMLEHDRGPIFTPDAYARNMARIAQARAEDRYLTYGDSIAKPGDAGDSSGEPLAGGPGDPYGGPGGVPIGGGMPNIV